jgi:hypothetical protein
MHTGKRKMDKSTLNVLREVQRPYNLTKNLGMEGHFSLSDCTGFRYDLWSFRSKHTRCVKETFRW